MRLSSVFVIVCFQVIAKILSPTRRPLPFKGLTGRLILDLGLSHALSFRSPLLVMSHGSANEKCSTFNDGQRNCHRLCPPPGAGSFGIPSGSGARYLANRYWRFQRTIRPLPVTRPEFAPRLCGLF